MTTMVMTTNEDDNPPTPQEVLDSFDSDNDSHISWDEFWHVDKIILNTMTTIPETKKIMMKKIMMKRTMMKRTMMTTIMNMSQKSMTIVWFLLTLMMVITSAG